MTMSSRAILTTAQSRLTLHLLLFTLSGVAIASSVSKAGSGGTTMFSGSPGDMRGVNSVLGGAGVALACLARIALLGCPTSWKTHIDRFEFGLVTVLWICWTSATMAFSAFTITRGICDSAAYTFPLPTCSILTFDLVLVHLASLTTLTLLLVILSGALQPAVQEDTSKDDVWVMWDLALQDGDAESSTSHAVGPTTYGTQAAEGGVTRAVVQGDKFENGRLRTYGSLLVCSVCSFASAIAAAMVGGEQVPSAYLLEIVAGLSMLSAGYCLISRQGSTGATRRNRVIEVSLGSFFFLLWPIAAITYTLLPALANRPCAPVETPDSGTTQDPVPLLTLCTLSAAAIASAWFASWLLFARLLGLVFPMPSERLAGVGAGAGERAPLLLAGRDFELGDDDDDERVVLIAR